MNLVYVLLFEECWSAPVFSELSNFLSNNPPHSVTVFGSFYTSGTLPNFSQEVCTFFHANCYNNNAELKYFSLPNQIAILCLNQRLIMIDVLSSIFFKITLLNRKRLPSPFPEKRNGKSPSLHTKGR